MIRLHGTCINKTDKSESLFHKENFVKLWQMSNSLVSSFFLFLSFCFNFQKYNSCTSVNLKWKNYHHIVYFLRKRFYQKRQEVKRINEFISYLCEFQIVNFRLLQKIIIKKKTHKMKYRNLFEWHTYSVRDLMTPLFI